MYRTLPYSGHFHIHIDPSLFFWFFFFKLAVPFWLLLVGTAGDWKITIKEHCVFEVAALRWARTQKHTLLHAWRHIHSCVALYNALTAHLEVTWQECVFIPLFPLIFYQAPGIASLGSALSFPQMCDKYIHHTFQKICWLYAYLHLTVLMPWGNHHTCALNKAASSKNRNQCKFLQQVVLKFPCICIYILADAFIQWDLCINSVESKKLHVLVKVLDFILTCIFIIKS